MSSMRASKGFGSGGGLGLLALACLALASLTGCVATAPEKKPVDLDALVWPAPPDKPRFRFVAEYRGEADLGKDAFKASLLGEERGGITLGKPYGVATSADGETIYVTDTLLRAVMIFDLKAKRVGLMETDARGGLRSPIEVRIDKRGRAFVSDSERKEVLVYSAEGKTLLTLGKKEELGRPTGLALDEARNRLYVADTAKHRIVVYDLEGKFLTAFGERGSGPGQFNYPVNLAVDREGHLLVTDSGNFRIQVVDGEGRHVRVFGQVGDSYGSFSRPKGIGLDSDGNIYVADAAFNNFQVFDREGRVLMFVGHLGKEPGMFWIPTDIYVDAHDRVYVVDSVNARIQVFQYLKEKAEPTGK